MRYLTGYSPGKDRLGILAFPVDFPSSAEFTMFYTRKGDLWGQIPFKFDIASLAYLEIRAEPYKGWWLLGKRGEIVEVVPPAKTGSQVRIVQPQIRIDLIKTAGTGPKKYGYLSRIRLIDGELFICGYRRQVYHRNGDKWDLTSADILDAEPKPPWKGFESIDGFAKNDIYTTGDEGEIWHFDGKQWKQCESPTKENLADIRCIDGKVWACGDGGVILSGDKNGFNIVYSDNKPSENWWSLESFFGKIYVAGNDFLGVLSDGKILPVKVDLKNKITTETLQAKDGVLWSIGEKDILAFDGKRWQEFTVPENR